MPFVIRVNDKNNRGCDGRVWPFLGECGPGRGWLSWDLEKDASIFRGRELNSTSLWAIIDVHEQDLTRHRGYVYFRGGNVVFTGNHDALRKLVGGPPEIKYARKEG